MQASGERYVREVHTENGKEYSYHYSCAADFDTTSAMNERVVHVMEMIKQEEIAKFVGDARKGLDVNLNLLKYATAFEVKQAYSDTAFILSGEVLKLTTERDYLLTK